MKVFEVGETYDGVRIDAYITSCIPEITRSIVHKLFDDKKVKVDGQLVKPSYKPKLGDKISVDFDFSNQSPPDITPTVLYEDEDCIVIDKPAGLLTHSKGVFNPEATVASFVHKIAPNMTGERSGIVHRLDRATSGVIICAKSKSALVWLQKQFSLRKVKKTYIAIVYSNLNPKEAILDLPIERNPKQPQTFRVGHNGKNAITSYKVIKSNSTYDEVKLKPSTGRTHQLRVHMQYLKHPIVGDPLYSHDKGRNSRMMLHAESLEITLPNRVRKVFVSKLPGDFDKLMNESV